MAVKVSVLMAVHDGEKYLRQAVDSILAQTFSDFEFIIVDDGSSDNTIPMLEKYAAEDRRIVLVRNKINLGLARSLNFGLDLAKGEYIARMDADDVSLPERFAVQVLFLDTHPKVGALATAANLIDAQGMVGPLVQFPEQHVRLQWIMCFFENPIIHPSVMLRRKVIGDKGGYDESFITSQDFDLWSRMAQSTELANIQDVYLHLRKHEENISHTRYHQQQADALRISASLISSILNFRIQPARINGYCDFLWNRTRMPLSEIPFAARIIYRLAKQFPGKSQMDHLDGLWIVENAINRIDAFKQESGLPPIEQLKLDYWKWSLKHSL